MRITHELIAQRIGVSRVAVSQVLNNSRDARISEEKCREIRALAQQLGYQPRNMTTHTIGYVASFELLGVQEMEVLQQVWRAAAQRGYRLALVDWNDDLNAMRRALNAKTVDGVVFTRWHEGKIKRILPPQVPWIVIADEDGIDPQSTQVTVDAAGTMRVLTEHLIARGHHRFCLISGRGGAFHSHVRRGYYEALSAAGLPRRESSCIEVIHAEEIARPMLKQLQSATPPSAVIALEAVRALAVVNLLQSEGYRIPQHVSVASMFNSHHFNWLRPSLTTTSVAIKALAPLFIEHLLQKLDDPARPTQHALIRGTIIEGDSVAPPKKRRVARLV